MTANETGSGFYTAEDAERHQRTMEIAQTISQQIGARTFFMLGTQRKVAVENRQEQGLAFNIRGSKLFNNVRVILEPSDTYRIEFLRVRKFEIRNAKTVTGVYVEDMHRIIEDETGPCTRIPNVIFSKS